MLLDVAIYLRDDVGHEFAPCLIVAAPRCASLPSSITATRTLIISLYVCVSICCLPAYAKSSILALARSQSERAVHTVGGGSGVQARAGASAWLGKGECTGTGRRHD